MATGSIAAYYDEGAELKRAEYAASGVTGATSVCANIAGDIIADASHPRHLYTASGQENFSLCQ